MILESIDKPGDPRQLLILVCRLQICVVHFQSALAAALALGKKSPSRFVIPVQLFVDRRIYFILFYFAFCLLDFLFYFIFSFPLIFYFILIFEFYHSGLFISIFIFYFPLPEAPALPLCVPLSIF